MAESPTTPAAEPSGGGAAPAGILTAGLALFALILAGFGGLSYGFYHFGATWAGLGFAVGVVGLFVALLSVLRPFFLKCTGRLVFGLWLIAILGAYFFFLFGNNKYPMGIDLAGGTELIYRLDYSQTERNIEEAEKALAAARSKDANSPETREFSRQVETLRAAKNSAPDKAADVVRRRVDPTGTKGVPVTTLGSDKQRLRIQLPKATPEEVNRIKTAIETQGRLTFHIVSDDQDITAKTKASPTKIYTDPNTKVEYEQKVIKKAKQFSEKEEFTEQPVVIKRVPGMDGSKITLAMARHSSEGTGYEIGVRFSAQGQADFGKLTEQNQKKQMAIMLDGVVYSAPVIQEAIYGECRISGNFDQEEAERLAGVLTAGSLPAEVKYENEYTVGPSLGQEQIASGMNATIIGTVVVVLFMFVYYRLCGGIASLCSAMNILMLLGAMGFFKATLTLPGIAGIVLTLGMSVDANVLILERVREEYARGRPVRLAIGHGFDRAFLTIIDCNLTTLISGIILYYLGTGPVRGFAVTLSIGILTTLFCNLWLNEVMMEWLVSREALAKVRMMQFFKTTNLNFMAWRRFWILTTGSTAVLSVVLFCVFGSRFLDVDFKGGTLVQFNFAPGKSQDFEELKKLIEGPVTEGVKQRAERLSADLKARLGEAPTELPETKPGEASAALQATRITEIEKSMQNFDLRPQPFGTPVAGKYRSFTITTMATDPGVIEALTDQLKDSFSGTLEPPPITRADKTLRVRFDAFSAPAPDVAEKRVKTALTEAARDPANAAIKEPLEKLLLSTGSTETEEGYLVVALPALPDDPKMCQKIEDALGTVRLDGRAGGAISRKSSFGSQVASEMWRDALLALLIANLGVFIYLWFRFEFSGAWGFGAIVALIHDTCVATGAVVVANLLGWPLLFDLNVVAALLTIIGFSVNDTIVIFDRIREVKAAHPTRDLAEIVNEAVNATLSRTILTSLTVLLADLSLLIFGGPTIRGLAYTLLVGFVVGTYSSVFIASPLMIWWYHRFGGGTAPVPVSQSKQPKGEEAQGAEV